MNNTLKLREKSIIVICMLVTAVICILLVWLNAYASELQYDINSINSQMESSQWKERNLEVKIESANNVSNLEEKALELGMVHADFDNIVYIRGESEPVRDFALALKRNAYE